MSSCILSVKNSNWLKRDILLYQHNDGHPNNMFTLLTDTLREIYHEFNDHGDPNWFMDPSRVAGALVVRSVPVITEEVRNLMKSLPPAAKSVLESSIFLGMPALFPEVSRSFNPAYEYSVTLKEDVEEGNTLFLGYTIEVYKLQSGRRFSTIMKSDENFLSRRAVSIVSDEEN